MRSHIVVGLLAVAAAALPDRFASAKVPYPPFCTVTQPMIACPAGDIPFTTIFHNALDQPCNYVWVSVSFENCPTVRFPPVLGDEGYLMYAGPVIGGQGDFDGALTLHIRAGGTCAASTVRVYGDGMMVAQRALASPDQDGNYGVGVDDLAAAQAKLGSADPTADFDGDGAVTEADLDILRAHLGHHAPGMATPVASRSWGTLKLTYR
jgi:hypothetical protein